MTNALAIPGISIGLGSPASPIDRKAQQLFENTLRIGQIKSWLSRLAGKSRRLLEFEDAHTDASTNNQHYVGAQVVPLRQIRGTLGKADSFDADFHPLNKRSVSRWINIARAMLRNIHLPPVVLFQIGSVYYVSDGHHRVSVARAIKKDFIDAVVTIRE
ncbi:MAG: hypothetical protein GY803_02135 [Chloroflexi bacterium]|nr:hypothetical protein [Chloroflexota bacterium]